MKILTPNKFAGVCLVAALVGTCYNIGKNLENTTPNPTTTEKIIRKTEVISNPMSPVIYNPLSPGDSYPAGPVISNLVKQTISNAEKKVISNPVSPEVSNLVKQTISNAEKKVISNPVSPEVSNLVKQTISNAEKQVISNPVKQVVSNPVSPEVSNPVSPEMNLTDFVEHVSNILVKISSMPLSTLLQSCGWALWFFFLCKAMFISYRELYIIIRDNIRNRKNR
jgi:uncharacterized protein YejL (UPF0352 family)